MEYNHSKKRRRCAHARQSFQRASAGAHLVDEAEQYGACVVESAVAALEEAMRASLETLIARNDDSAVAAAKWRLVAGGRNPCRRHGRALRVPGPKRDGRDLKGGLQ